MLSEQENLVFNSKNVKTGQADVRATFAIQTEIWQYQHAYIIENGTTNIFLPSY